MNYFIKDDGVIVAYTDNQVTSGFAKGLTEVLCPVMSDGKILPNHPKVPELTTVNNDGITYYEYYKKDLKPDFEKIKRKKLEKIKREKLEKFKEKYLVESTEDVEYEENFYKGGDLSASAISGAVLLSQSLGESDTEIVDNSDKKHTLSFAQAQELTSKIAKIWRTSFLKYKDLKVKVSEATTIEELNLIVWVD